MTSPTQMISSEGLTDPLFLSVFTVACGELKPMVSFLEDIDSGDWVYLTELPRVTGVGSFGATVERCAVPICGDALGLWVVLIFFDDGGVSCSNTSFLGGFFLRDIGMMSRVFYIPSCPSLSEPEVMPGDMLSSHTDTL